MQGWARYALRQGAKDEVEEEAAALGAEADRKRKANEALEAEVAKKAKKNPAVNGANSIANFFNKK